VNESVFVTDALTIKVVHNWNSKSALVCCGNIAWTALDIPFPVGINAFVAVCPLLQFTLTITKYLPVLGKLITVLDGLPLILKPLPSGVPPN
jgi:hypothetical protein